MALTVSQLKQWFQKNPKKSNWANWCQAVIYWAAYATGGAKTTYATATDAYRASTIKSKDPSAAPLGAIHYWSYTATIGGVRKDYGHVAISLGSGKCLMATSSPDEKWATGLGVVGVAAWTKRMGSKVTYRGWSKTNGRNTVKLTAATTASSSSSSSSGKRALRVAANRRQYPVTVAKVGKTYAKGTKLTVDTWRVGETVKVGSVTSNVWFGIKGTGQYVSAACFSDRSTKGLKRISNLYVKLSTRWYYYLSLADAKRGKNAKGLVPSGMHLVVFVSGSGPYLIYVGALRKLVWVGTSRTLPGVVKE